MHTFTLLSTFLASIVLAVPYAQYESGHDVEIFTSSTILIASSTSLTTSYIPVHTTAVPTTSFSILSTFNNGTSSAPTISTEPSTSTSSFIPVPTTTTTPLKPAGVYICNDVDWSGTCIHHFSNPTSSDSDCVQLDGTASSVGPDEGFVCWFFTNAYCRPLQSDGLDFIQLSYPGTKNMLQTYKGDLNDKIHSYFCLPEKESDK
ncbi:hypothetical protein DE146DRAFT_510552 [Phaeosphaeria sp. MPI-PUGE-AT-0046c]|nr:hypothetical protein DE146DRAFT_510552 [Phaeosphaeria sp. MPI-PUGE-AT-0046c]